MAYKSPLNNLPVFKTQKFEREYGKPVVAPEVNIPQQRFDFSEVSGASKDTGSDTKVNPARAARQKGRQERRQVRQEARAKRIEKRQDKKTVKAMQRQDKKNVGAGIAQDFQKSLPKPDARKAEKVLNEFVEKNKPKISGEMLTGFVPSSGGNSSITPKTKITGALGSDLRKKQYDDAGFKYDDTIKGYNKDGSEIEVPATRGRGKFGPVSMKDEGAPTKMLGTMIAPIASRLQAALGIDAGGNPTRQRSGNILRDAGVLIGAGTRAAGAAPVDPVAPMTPTGGDMQDPFAGKTFSIVESPANMKGNAKPVFNESTSDAAAMMYGSPAERQMSMPKAGTSAMSMKDIPEGDKGAGLRALDDSVVEQMGYDSATKMMSPLDSHHPQYPGLKKALEVGANILMGGGYNTAKNLLSRNNPPKTFTKEKTNMPKKRVPRVNPGYVTDINTGERIGVEEIPFKDFKQR